MMLSDLATVIRSKNAGPFELTFDVLFSDPSDYQRVVRSDSSRLSHLRPCTG